MNEKKDVLEMEDMWEKEVYELQKSLQQSYKRIKALNEIISKQRDKIFYLEGRPGHQLEFNF